MGLSDSDWRGRRVLVTGHTGFKGGWLTLLLTALGARVTGIALEPAPAPHFFAACGGPWANVDHRIVDIRDARAVRETVGDARPEVAFHLAAQALVPVGHADPIATYETNVVGTATVLDAFAGVGPAAVVVVTSDKVYAPHAEPRRETDPLGGGDPYSASKAAAELVVGAWRATTALPVATARAGNVIGGGDWAVGRLVPDTLRAVLEGGTVALRDPDGVRPWQYVADVVRGYVTLAEALAGAANAPASVNFGPPAVGDVRASEVVEHIIRVTGRGAWRAEPSDLPELGALRLDPTLAQDALGWTARTPLHAAIEETVRWHDAQRRGDDMLAFSTAQLEAHLAAAA